MCHLWWLFLTAIVGREARLCRTEEEVETLKETCISHTHLSVTRISDKLSSWTKDLVWFTFAQSTWQKGYGGRDAGVEWGANQEPGAHRKLQVPTTSSIDVTLLPTWSSPVGSIASPNSTANGELSNRNLWDISLMNRRWWAGILLRRSGYKDLHGFRQEDQIGRNVKWFRIGIDIILYVHIYTYIYT